MHILRHYKTSVFSLGLNVSLLNSKKPTKIMKIISIHCCYSIKRILAITNIDATLTDNTTRPRLKHAIAIASHLLRSISYSYTMGTRVYQNKTPVSRGCSPRVRAFCCDIPRSNHGITILYPKSSSH